MLRALHRESKETWAEAIYDVLMKYIGYCAEKNAGKKLVQAENHQREL